MFYEDIYRITRLGILNLDCFFRLINNAYLAMSKLAPAFFSQATTSKYLEGRANHNILS